MKSHTIPDFVSNVLVINCVAGALFIMMTSFMKDPCVVIVLQQGIIVLMAKLKFTSFKDKANQIWSKLRFRSFVMF